MENHVSEIDVPEALRQNTEFYSELIVLIVILVIVNFLTDIESNGQKFP